VSKAVVHYSADQDKLIQKFYLKDDGVFPNNSLPVLYYPGVLLLPGLFPAGEVKDIFTQNDWKNPWQSGIYTFHHYHSNTHEVIGVVRGETTIELGGDNGVRLKIQKGDVIILPAGTAHKNLGDENAVVCVGAYPKGKEYDMFYGQEGDRPGTDENIKKVKIPDHDPVFGTQGGVLKYWIVGSRAN
jgi:uncharacterized protein YjlB